MENCENYGKIIQNKQKRVKNAFQFSECAFQCSEYHVIWTILYDLKGAKENVQKEIFNLGNR